MTFRTSFLAVAAVATLTLVIVSGPALEGQEARGKAALLKPAALTEQAPATFKVNFDTSAGPFVVEVHKEWAPIGVDRFYNMVKRGFYDGNRFFRVTNLMAVFGINGDPDVAQAWITSDARIPNDPEKGLAGSKAYPNKKGTIAFLQQNMRRSQTFINLVDNPTLDVQITPFGQVVSGMDVVLRVYKGYGEPAPTGKGPTMTDMVGKGNAYLEKEFPNMDYIKTATIMP